MAKKSKKFYIDTLGCAKNEYDSQVLAAELLGRGCENTLDPEEADILIVNTCGFIDDAKRESIEHIFNMAAFKGEDKKLVVTGCLSQRYHAELSKEIPEVDIFTGVNDYDDLPSILLGEESAAPDKNVCPGECPASSDRSAVKASSDMVKGREEKVLPYRERVFPQNEYSSVLKIAEGCNNACTFCAIPMIRGPYRSKRIEDAVREAEDMAAAGIKEVTIIAQDTSYYGKDIYGEAKLPELLRELCRIDGIKWIRLMYVYDDGITDEFIDTIASEEKICNYIDIPIQHISDGVLSAMHRNSTSESIRATVKKLRSRIKDIHIRTTLLVGFPGETEEDFEELLDFIEEAKFERLGAFAFSEEEGTPAYELGGKVPEEIKEARRNAVMEKQVAISEEVNAAKVGGVFEVIVDECTGEGLYVGRTEYDSPEIDDEVSFTALAPHEPGDFVKVMIEEAYEYDLVGKEVLDESA